MDNTYIYMDMVPFSSLMSTTSYHKFFQTPPCCDLPKKIQIWISPPQTVHRLPRVHSPAATPMAVAELAGGGPTPQVKQVHEFSSPQSLQSPVTWLDSTKRWEICFSFFVFREGRRQQNLTTIGSVDSLHIIWNVDILDGTCSNWQNLECIALYCSAPILITVYYFTNKWTIRFLVIFQCLDQHDDPVMAQKCISPHQPLPTNHQQQQLLRPYH